MERDIKTANQSIGRRKVNMINDISETPSSYVDIKLKLEKKLLQKKSL